MLELKEALMEVLGELESGTFSLNFASGGLGLLVYVLKAIALYSIATRREIKNPWLAWVPVGDLWILGSLSDQYQYVVKKQVKNKRKVLLGLGIATTVIVIVFVAVVAWMLIDLLFVATDILDVIDQSAEDFIEVLASNLVYYFGNNIIVLSLLSLLAIPLAVLATIQTVYFYIALYDVFCSSDPKNSTLYIVLSIVGNFMVEGVYCIFLMLCKDKDLGMPPRKTEVVAPPEILEETPANMEE